MYMRCFFFFFQAEDGIRDVAVTGVQTCALPISCPGCPRGKPRGAMGLHFPIIKSMAAHRSFTDRKSTRLNSSHGYISYAVFCLKKKKHIHDRPSHKDLGLHGVVFGHRARMSSAV